MSKWIATSNQGFSPYGMEELRKIFSPISFKQLIPGEVYQFEVPQENDQVIAMLSEAEKIFIRHVQPIDRMIDITGDAVVDGQALADMVSYIESSVAGKRVAVHIRFSHSHDLTASKLELKQAIEEALLQAEAEPVKQEPDLIIALFAHEQEMLIGFGTVEEMGSDWPGGAIRFQREEGQVSRAKFKLLEAEKVFGLDYSNYSAAIDVGAAPGGWTSLLLERGLKVTAIDPAALDERIVYHPKLTHLRMNASNVKLPKGSFDLLVCDMSWSPNEMSKLVLSLAPAIKPYSYAIITVKLMHKKGLQSIKDVKQRLSSSFTILGAKQLFHNREEITLFLQKKG
ncbi:SAM-dependent methyltransferase [Paenibacillus septentrionalis]|uniref:SAM-dependent methyltransferase n=1 Tax=Paenibacillus septentrionalis TaxID=429342 RepID=A0ABW1V0X7_9BACL